jgi:hypothetical protein
MVELLPNLELNPGGRLAGGRKFEILLLLSIIRLLVLKTIKGNSISLREIR